MSKTTHSNNDKSRKKSRTKDPRLTLPVHLRPFIKSLGCVTRANDLHGVTQYQQLINTTKHLRTSTSHSKERKNSVLSLFEQKESLYSNLVISILFRPSFQPVHHCTLKFVWYNFINNSNFENNLVHLF